MDSATLNSATANPQLQSHFMRVPLEIRCMVYKLLFYKEPYEDFPSPKKWFIGRLPGSRDRDVWLNRNQNQALTMAILLTCRLAHNEALPVYFSLNQFVFDIRALDMRTARPRLTMKSIHTLINTYSPLRAHSITSVALLNCLSNENLSYILDRLTAFPNLEILCVRRESLTSSKIVDADRLQLDHISRKLRQIPQLRRVEFWTVLREFTRSVYQAVQRRHRENEHKLAEAME